MAQNEHIATLPPEMKRSAILMALDTAGVAAEDVVSDAAQRQRALQAYEKLQQEAIDEFEARKSRENSRIQAEIERLTSQLMTRIEANNAETAREKEGFRAWQSRKQRELQRISGALDLCASKNAPITGPVALSFDRAVSSKH
ncbi:MAG: hypothetical protein FJW37_03790 [Acidobacteria bacterium]|nr:hypothetical protein [Acidobacteriota bacterium]